MRSDPATVSAPAWLTRLVDAAGDRGPDRRDRARPGARRPTAAAGAAAVLIAFCDDAGRAGGAAHRARARHALHAGQAAFPGGAVEPGDADAAATALREADEEVGLDPASVRGAGRAAASGTCRRRTSWSPRCIAWWAAAAPGRGGRRRRGRAGRRRADGRRWPTRPTGSWCGSPRSGPVRARLRGRRPVHLGLHRRPARRAAAPRRLGTAVGSRRSPGRCPLGPMRDARRDAGLRALARSSSLALRWLLAGCSNRSRRSTAARSRVAGLGVGRQRRAAGDASTSATRTGSPRRDHRASGPVQVTLVHHRHRRAARLLGDRLPGRLRPAGAAPGAPARRRSPRRRRARYQFVCTIHEAQGQTGTLIVLAELSVDLLDLFIIVGRDRLRGRRLPQRRRGRRCSPSPASSAAPSPGAQLGRPLGDSGRARPGPGRRRAGLRAGRRAGRSAGAGLGGPAAAQPDHLAQPRRRSIRASARCSASSRCCWWPGWSRCRWPRRPTRTWPRRPAARRSSAKVNDAVPDERAQRVLLAAELHRPQRIPAGVRQPAGHPHRQRRRRPTRRWPTRPGSRRPNRPSSRSTARRPAATARSRVRASCTRPSGC